MAQVKEKTIAEKNERITFQKNDVAVDEYRNHTSSWSDYLTAWAYASTYIANEEESAVTSDERRITFHVRWCSELSKVTSNGYRILFHGEVYNILSVDLMNYQKREIRFSCRKEKR